MARGNQRELAREKNAKKQDSTKAGDTAANAGLTPAQRTERDKNALLEKAAKKKAAAEAAEASGTPLPPKPEKAAKTSSKNQALNALLSAGVKSETKTNKQKLKDAGR